MKYIGFRKIREEEAQEVGGNCQTPKNLRTEQRKEAWARQYHHDFPQV